MEYLHGSVCHYCSQVLTLRVNVADVRDDQGALIDVSIEVDMDPWWEHVTAHREAGDVPRVESLLTARVPGAH